MVFKPFKPPLIRKNTQASNTKPDLPIDTLDNHGPPAKRPRLHQECTVDSAGPSMRTERKPLVQVSNTCESGDDNVKDESAGERYFNVLWYDLVTTVFLKDEREGQGPKDKKADSFQAETYH
ncbi:unnamed protein product [Aspergillus oryzae]|uniref:Unnamed protein product n=2 Tax=Aspergillus oryzae TaxID=5062 RepID=A0AAN4YEI9_ASPOZ|nr:unnamed protein product [Aspergillus oryzae]GMF87065.1 unnamed protein product [Aspergillus oryzae]GMG08526.1 unnamed protein product [Aspergillus oryzae]GMG25404.1 unnamed protein product [Aspergillus oryzae]GMG45602.1 unnamed protein product [Aspergillus oryzae var. brunneus]